MTLPGFQLLLSWIGMPLPPPWLNPDGFFFVLFILGLLGVEIVFLIGAIRRTVYEFRESTRIWWKITLRISLAIMVLGFVAVTILLWVML